MSVPAARCYSLAMGLTNLLAATLLLMICIVNAHSDTPNLFVTLVGPLATAVFAIISGLWMVDAFVRQGKDWLQRIFFAQSELFLK